MELVSEEKEGMKCVVLDNKIGRPTKSWGQRLLKFRPEPSCPDCRLLSDFLSFLTMKDYETKTDFRDVRITVLIAICFEWVEKWLNW